MISLRSHDDEKLTYTTKRVMQGVIRSSKDSSIERNPQSFDEEDSLNTTNSGSWKSNKCL